jgi:predicted Fe-Mo cluster-binding NifX family protein
MKVAIPRFEEQVAPCYEYSATIAIFTLEGKNVAGQMDFRLESRNVFDRLRLLRDQQVDVLICGGVQNTFEDMVKASGIHVISWVSGSVEDLLEQYLRGELVSRAERLESGSCAVTEPRKTEGADKAKKGRTR